MVARRRVGASTLFSLACILLLNRPAFLSLSCRSAQLRGAPRLRVSQRAVAETAGSASCVQRRKGFLASVASGCGLLHALVPLPASASDQVTLDVLARAKEAIADIIKADPDNGPSLVRLAYHHAGTYDKVLNNGGPRGTIRFGDELQRPANIGLEKAVALLEPVKQSNPSLSYADLFTLAGVVAIKELGGPKVPWRAGRVDSMDPNDIPPEARMPVASEGTGTVTENVKQVRDTFYRMGFDDKETVALCGAHGLGRCFADGSENVGLGPWSWQRGCSETPTKFGNLYFKILKEIKWEKGCIILDGKSQKCKEEEQYRDRDSKQLLALPTDLALIKDGGFNKYVDLYADDDGRFRKEFSKAFAKFLELGAKDLYTVQ